MCIRDSHTGKHLRGAHRHVGYGHIAVIQLGIAQQQVGHQVDDAPAGEVRSGLLAEGLGKALDEILKDIAAVHGADLIRTEVEMCIRDRPSAALCLPR